MGVNSVNQSLFCQDQFPGSSPMKPYESSKKEETMHFSSKVCRSYMEMNYNEVWTCARFLCCTVLEFSTSHKHNVCVRVHVWFVSVCACACLHIYTYVAWGSSGLVVRVLDYLSRGPQVWSQLLLLFPWARSLTPVYPAVLMGPTYHVSLWATGTTCKAWTALTPPGYLHSACMVHG